MLPLNLPAMPKFLDSRLQPPIAEDLAHKAFLPTENVRGVYDECGGERGDLRRDVGLMRHLLN